MRVYVQFIQKEVPDTSAQILEQCSRRLNLLLTHWKTVAQFFSNNKVFRQLHHVSVRSGV